MTEYRYCLSLLYAYVLVISLGAQTRIQNEALNETQNNLDGFGGISWGSTYKDVKERFRVLGMQKQEQSTPEILYDNPGKELLIKRDDIRYRYVFYKKTDLSSTESPISLAVDMPTEKMIPEDMAHLFFVETTFILVESNRLYKKLKAKYRKPISNTVKMDQNGAYVWDLAEGYVIQWQEHYHKSLFTRNVYYISKKIKKEIAKDLDNYFFSKEFKTIDKILP